VDTVGFVDPEEGDDVGVIQRGDRLGLALEAQQAIRVAGQRLGQYLQGDQAVQPEILGGVHVAHPPLPSARTIR